MSQFDPAAAAATILAARNGAERPADLDQAPPDTDAAYAVQRHVIAGLGQGGAWKIAMLEGRHRHTSVMPRSEISMWGETRPALPKDACVEVETALILGADLPAGSDAAAARAAVAEVRLALELVSSRFADRTAANPLSGMADNFSSAGIVLGDQIEDWDGTLEGKMGLGLSYDGTAVEVTEVAQPLTGAIEFLVWLAGHAEAQGLPLRRGDVLITGARIGPLPMNGATEIRASAGSAEVSVNFA